MNTWARNMNSSFDSEESESDVESETQQSNHGGTIPTLMSSIIQMRPTKQSPLAQIESQVENDVSSPSSSDAEGAEKELSQNSL